MICPGVLTYRFVYWQSSCWWDINKSTTSSLPPYSYMVATRWEHARMTMQVRFLSHSEWTFCDLRCIYWCHTTTSDGVLWVRSIVILVSCHPLEANHSGIQSILARFQYDNWREWQCFLFKVDHQNLLCDIIGCISNRNTSTCDALSWLHASFSCILSQRQFRWQLWWQLWAEFATLKLLVWNIFLYVIYYI